MQIHLQKGNYKLAEQSLEVGLSYNFEVSFAKAVLTRFLQDYKHRRKKRLWKEQCQEQSCCYEDTAKIVLLNFTGHETSEMHIHSTLFINMAVNQNS